jgi:hypothetical protein
MIRTINSQLITSDSTTWMLEALKLGTLVIGNSGCRTSRSIAALTASAAVASACLPRTGSWMMEEDEDE